MTLPAPPDNRPSSLSLSEAAPGRLLEPAKLRFQANGAALRLILEDEYCYLKVSVLRLFPISRPAGYYSVRDSAGQEIGIITDPSRLSAGDRRLVEDEIRRRYMVSVVLRIVRIEERFGTVEWTVETDRGPVRFTTREHRENTVNSVPGSFLLTDVEGSRFHIPDIDSLDLPSRILLSRHL
jgi:hypothetical protein